MRWNLKWKTRNEKPPAWCDPACFGGVVADENALVRIDRRKRSFKKSRLAFDVEGEPQRVCELALRLRRFRRRLFFQMFMQ
jgi:hypothetical protein